MLFLSRIRRKGVETAPLLILFGAVALILALGIILPALQDWQEMMDRGKAVKEGTRLRDAINELYAMGDYGSITKVEINMPPGYYLDIETNKIQVRDDKTETNIVELMLDTPIQKHTINKDPQGLGQRERAGEIFAGDEPVVIVIGYWKDDSPINAPYQILI